MAHYDVPSVIKQAVTDHSRLNEVETKTGGLGLFNGYPRWSIPSGKKFEWISETDDATFGLRPEGSAVYMWTQQLRLLNSASQQTAVFNGDGDVQGAAWGGWLSAWLSNNVGSKLSNVTNPSGQGITITSASIPRVELAHAGFGSVMMYLSSDLTTTFAQSTGSGAGIAVIYTITWGGQLQIQGAGYALGGWHTGSDIRIKDNIKPTAGLDAVKTLRGVSWDWATREGGRSAGLIAQELQEVLPEAVTTSEKEDGLLCVNYGAVTALLVNAIKELSAQVDELKAQLKEVTK